jgi:hypothetical protein
MAGPSGVIKVGRVNVRATCDVRFSPTGPVFRQEHKVPLAHVVRVVSGVEISPLEMTGVWRVETRAVLAAAYPGGSRAKLDSTLTHAVEVDVAGNEIRVRCGRVKLANLADSGATDPLARPTCPRCAR